LHSEIASRQSYSTTYGYNTWSPPVQSNETASGVYLERTKSAKLTLGKVMQIAQNLPREEKEETQSGERSDDDVPEVDPDATTEVLGSTSAEVPSHPPPPYSPTQAPPPPPIPSSDESTKPSTGSVSGRRMPQSLSDPSTLGNVPDPTPPQ